MGIACAILMTVEASEVPKGCEWNTHSLKFADMQDGDEKKVFITNYNKHTNMTDMTIKPHGNNQTWVVNTKIDCETGKATVDFNVPGKEDHPPVPIQATRMVSVTTSHDGHGSAGFGSLKYTFIFTDDSGELVDDPTFPLNAWVAETDEMYLPQHCPESLQAVFADMHDGDKKQVTIAGRKMTIVPSGNDQEWTVNADFDRDTCSAVIDFNVPGKPDFPPVNLTATYWQFRPRDGEFHPTLDGSANFEFTDPSATLAAADFPLNRWVELAKQVVVV